MQIREKSTKVLCIRTEYLPEKKRTHGRTIASQDAYLSTVTDEVREKLTGEEVEELEAWLNKRTERWSADSRKMYLFGVDRWMAAAADALDDESARENLSSDQADKMWQAHERLSKALRRHGYRKPKRAPAKKRRRDDQPGLPLHEKG